MRADTCLGAASFAIRCSTRFDPLVDSDALAECSPNGDLYGFGSVAEANEGPNMVYILPRAGGDPK